MTPRRALTLSMAITLCAVALTVPALAGPPGGGTGRGEPPAHGQDVGGGRPADPGHGNADPRCGNPTSPHGGQGCGDSNVGQGHGNGGSPNVGQGRGNTGTPRTPGGPASMAACKNGGWRALGFKNQGQCVSSVVSHR